MEVDRISCANMYEQIIAIPDAEREMFCRNGNFLNVSGCWTGYLSKWPGFNGQFSLLNRHGGKVHCPLDSC